VGFEQRKPFGGGGGVGVGWGKEQNKKVTTPERQKPSDRGGINQHSSESPGCVKIGDGRKVSRELVGGDGGEVLGCGVGLVGGVGCGAGGGLWKRGAVGGGGVWGGSFWSDEGGGG